MSEDVTGQVTDLVSAIHPILKGNSPAIIGAVLGDLVASLLAGHVVINPDNEIDDDQTEELREIILQQHIELVRDLIPINEASMLGRSKEKTN